MTTTAFDDQFTAEPELVRQQYSTADILRRNVADLEIALKQQAERTEAAEAELLAVREDNHSMMVEIDELRKELARLREQEPVAWMLECQHWTGDTAWLLSWSKSGAGQCNRLDGESHQRALYERHIPMERIDSIPAPATAATAVPEEWRNIVTEMLGWWDDPAMTMSQGKVIAEKARAMLQSVEVTK
jgi:septal ring factor EnvC (AmiA/AmiB activator)